MAEKLTSEPYNYAYKQGIYMEISNRNTWNMLPCSKVPTPGYITEQKEYTKAVTSPTPTKSYDDIRVSAFMYVHQAPPTLCILRNNSLKKIPKLHPKQSLQ